MLTATITVSGSHQLRRPVRLRVTQHTNALAVRQPKTEIGTALSDITRDLLQPVQQLRPVQDALMYIRQPSDITRDLRQPVQQLRHVHDALMYIRQPSDIIKTVQVQIAHI